MYDENSQVSNWVRFIGQYLDEDSGFYYNYFRDYDASLGRYLQSDPIGLAAGVNTYTYVLNDPVNSYDSLGLSARDVVQTIKDAMAAKADAIANENRVSGRGVVNAFIDNARAKIPGSSYNVCEDQVSDFRDRVREKYSQAGSDAYSYGGEYGRYHIQMDDLWTFENVDHDWFYEGSGGHQSIIATSSNPNDPVIEIDIWLGEMYINGQVVPL
jgi:RHS repeat-associated protein